MTIFLLLLLIFVVLFAREIRFIIGILFLYLVFLAIWDYWWGKVITIILTLFVIIGVIGLAGEKIAKTINYFKRDKEVSSDDELKRVKAFHHAMENWYKDGNGSEMERYRLWRKDPSAAPEIEEWYQENKEFFS